MSTLEWAHSPVEIVENVENWAKPLTVQKTTAKGGYVNVYLAFPLHDEVACEARGEPVRGLASFVKEVFLYGYQVYRRVRSLKALRELRKELEALSPGAELPQLAASKETYAELTAALGLILERAPATVVEEVAAILTDRAGKYATAPREPAAAPQTVRARAERAVQARQRAAARLPGK